MKKFLSLFGVVALSSTALTSLSSTIKVNSIEQNSPIIFDDEEINLDWNDIGGTLNNHFNALHEEIKIQNFSDIQNNSEINLTEEALNKAESIANNYLNNFKKRNTTFAEAFNTLINDSPEFKRMYEEKFQSSMDINYLDNKNSNEQSELGSSFFITNVLKKEDIQKAIDKTEELVVNLKALEPIFYTSTIAASIAATAFWAASWWFGITIPWAISATSISVSSSVIYGTAKSYRSKFGDQITITRGQLEHYQDGIKLIQKAFSIINNLVKSVEKIFSANAAIINANLWAFSAAVSLGKLLWSTIDFLISLHNYYSYLL